MTKEFEFKIGNLPEYKSKLIINENYHIHFITKMPNRWNRFWYKVLLGWQWRNQQTQGDKRKNQ
jgi:hypothetical protein